MTLNSQKMSMYISVYVPITACNLRCHYCYITQQRLFEKKGNLSAIPLRS